MSLHQSTQLTSTTNFKTSNFLLTSNTLSPSPSNSSYNKALLKIKSLEQTLENIQSTFEICNELINCIQTLPYGQSIINKSHNLKKLNYLLNFVLPRRKKALKELNSTTSMPAGIKNSLINRQLKLIKKATNEINKRSNYDKKIDHFLKSLHN